MPLQRYAATLPERKLLGPSQVGMRRSSPMHRLPPLLRVMIILLAVCATLVSPPVRAQSSQETGIISITVVDATSKAPLADARIVLLGATQASALTNRSGSVKYTDVPSGLYRVRVSKSGFGGSTSAQFEILGNKEVDIDVNLAAAVARADVPSGALATANGVKVIGRVSARVSISTHDVDADSSIRKVSDSLTDALGKIAGVDVTQSSNDPDAAQTISLNGHDESQTAITLDGIPLGAPGSATDLRSLNTDLFGGASVSFAAQAGSLGGAVNFRTLQPTQTWVSQASTSYGTFDRFNYQFGETGSFGKLGIALLHTLRESDNPLTFATYTDQSGLTYPHAGESSQAGNFLKLRYALDDRTTLNLTALQNDRGTSSLCTQDVTILPCGTGPGNTNANKYQFVYGTVQSLVGNVTTSLSTYVNSTDGNQNDALRYVDGVASPLVTTTKTLSRGIAFLSTVDVGRSTFSLHGSTYASVTNFMPTVNSSAFVIGSTAGTGSQTYALSDLYKINDRLSLGPNVSLASTNGSGTSLLGGLGGTWRPTGNDTYAASLSVGSSQPAAGLVRTFSDPAAARFNCAAGTAEVNGPGDLAGRQSAISYDASWTHDWKFGSLSLDVYHQSQADQLVNAQIVAAGLGFTAASPYVAALQNYFTSPYTCGPAAVLDPANVYVNEPIGDTTRVYEGFTLSGRIALGPHLVALPSYQTNGASVTAADARLAQLSSTTIVGAQIPGRPVHRGNLTLDGDLPAAGLELLANVQYVGSNNSQHIDPYALLSLGASHALGIGRIALLETNVFNTESGVLSSAAFAQPIATSGGGSLLLAANPNPPREFSLTYSFNTGAVRGAGHALPGRRATASAAVPTVAETGAAQRNRGLGAFTPFPPPPGIDPLSVADKRQSCTAADAALARPVLTQLRAAAAAFAAGQPLSPVTGIALVPHGSVRGADWYLEMRPDVGGTRDLNANTPPAGHELAGGSDAGGGPPPANAQHERLTVDGSREAPGGSVRSAPDPQRRAAFAGFRSTLNCAYFSALTQDAALTAGYTAFRGRLGVGYAPQVGLFAVRPTELGTGGGSLKH